MSKTIHGLSHSREYKAWMNMRTRCENENTPYWKNYGGRGIRICSRWSKFEYFLSDMGPKPKGSSSIDRINVNGNYEPNNCRWTDQKTQMRNIRANYFVEFNGRSMTLAGAVDETILNYNTVLYRMKRGWSVQDALTEPLQRGKKVICAKNLLQR